MATGGLSVIANNLAYFGRAKQSAWGTAITTPTAYHTWLDGSDVIDGAQHQQTRQGDTSPYNSLAWKSGQYWGFKIVEYVRPYVVGAMMQALLGSGSDTYTAPTKSTTLSGAGNTAGSTSVVVVGDLGNLLTLAVNINPGFASTTYEVVTLDLTTRSGTGPYTYTIANSGTLKYGHSAAEVVTSASKHVLTRQSGAYDPCTYEIGYGLTGSPIKGAIRMTDAVLTDMTITGQKGQLWRMEHNWLAATGKFLTGVQTLSQTSYEGANRLGVAGGPFGWYQGTQWNINGAGTGNGATIESFQLQLKNSTTWDDLQSELLTPVYFLPGTFDISGQMTVQWQSWAQYTDMYFGSASAANNAADDYHVGYESLDFICASDALNSFEIQLPKIFYTAAKLTPKLDGKALRQPLSFTALKNDPGSTPADAFVFTLNNSSNAQY